MPRSRDKIRDFPGKRWLNVSLRTAHVVGVVLLGVALLGGGEAGFAAALTLATGLPMLAIDAWANPAHLREIAGAGVVLKLALVALMAMEPAWALSLYWLTLVLSMLLSHAPGAFRHRRIF